MFSHHSLRFFFNFFPSLSLPPNRFRKLFFFFFFLLFSLARNGDGYGRFALLARSSPSLHGSRGGDCQWTEPSVSDEPIQSMQRISKVAGFVKPLCFFFFFFTTLKVCFSFGFVCFFVLDLKFVELGLVGFFLFFFSKLQLY